MDLADLSDQLETISASYARRHGFERDDVWFVLKLTEEVGELTEAFLARSGRTRPKGRDRHDAQALDAALGAELADVLAHTLLLARRLGIDPETAVQAKWLAWLPEPPATRQAGARDS